MRTYKTTLEKVATIERAKNGKFYPAGTVLIQLSASNGSVLLHAGGLVDSRYAVILPHDLDGRYLKTALEVSFPSWYQRTNQGINYSINDLPKCPILIHSDPEDQRKVVAVMEWVERRIDEEEKARDHTKSMKESLLDKMMI